MCFSPEADVTAAVVVGAIGVATLRLVRTRRELLIGLLPLLFAAHQLTEAFVWLGLRGQVSSGLGHAAIDAYAIFAFAVLPIIAPIGFLLLEPEPRERRRVIPFAVLGAAVGLYLLWQATQHPISAREEADGIAYGLHASGGYAVAVLYVIATCGPALLSSRRYLRWFGAVNIAAALIAATAQEVAFASIWCLYAALASLLVLEHFRRERATEPAGQRAALV